MMKPIQPPAFSLLSRSATEEHRAATPLELMFDLAAVIAIAATVAGMHHAFAEGHFIEGIINFIFSFFMIWIAWLNYTWFASAYDDESTLFRVLSMVIMFGALVLAAGIPTVFESGEAYITLTGFIIMRVCLVALWLAAARGDPAHRTVAHRYAFGLTAVQIYWTVMVLVLPAGSDLGLLFFAIGVVLELMVPAFAESKGTTPWHKHHIVERHNLLNIIVLGECFLAIVMAIQASTGHGHLLWGLIEIGVLASAITFMLWALYFSEQEHLQTVEKKHTMIWGYGHFALFATGAATGGGFAVMVEVATHHAHISEKAAALTVAIPVAIYVMTLWVIRDRVWMKGLGNLLMPAVAVSIILAGIFPVQPLLMITFILAGLLIAQRKIFSHRRNGSHFEFDAT
ncbi:low temperature requirement protein A [Profundibacter sp.]